jgi:two-component system, chemotaxis family, chemotaxis protein CheY
MIEPRRVLVVDDDESIRDLVEMALSAEGHQVITAPHGAAALEVIALAPPDVILLDMKMPVMDGWAFARAYRAVPGWHAPIVVVTAAQDAASRAAEVAADGHLSKPFDLDALYRVVEEYGSA